MQARNVAPLNGVSAVMGTPPNVAKMFNAAPPDALPRAKAGPRNVAFEQVIALPNATCTVNRRTRRFQMLYTRKMMRS